MFHGVGESGFNLGGHVLEFFGFRVKGNLMLGDFLVDSFVEFAVVHKDVFHLLKLFNDKGVLLQKRLHCDTSADKLFVDWYKIVEILIINEFLELLDLIL